MRKTHYTERTAMFESNHVLQVVFPERIKETSKMLAVIASDFELDPLLESYMKRYKLKAIHFKKLGHCTSAFICFNK